MVTLVDRAPALRAFEAALPAARTPEPAPPAVRAPEPALPAARPSRPPADPTLVMPAIAPRAPARPAAPAAPRLFTDEPVPPRRSEPEPPRPRAAPPPAEPDAPLDALPASLPLRLLRFTGRAAALLVLFTAAAGGGAYAARTYLPPWVARTEVVQRVDTWLQRVPALSELVR